MADKLPKVYYPRPDGSVKVLTPSHQAELEALLHMGWTLEPPKK